MAAITPLPVPRRSPGWKVWWRRRNTLRYCAHESPADRFVMATWESALNSPILAPLLALVLWSFVMGAWLYATRIPAIAKNNIVYDPRRPSEEFHIQLPAEVRWKADNYNNLMEQPTLFYAVTLTLALLGAGGGLNSRSRVALCRAEDCAQPRSGHRQCGHGSLRPVHGRVARVAGVVGAGGADRVLKRCRLASVRRAVRQRRPRSPDCMLRRHCPWAAGEPIIPLENERELDQRFHEAPNVICAAAANRFPRSWEGPSWSLYARCFYFSCSVPRPARCANGAGPERPLHQDG